MNLVNKSIEIWAPDNLISNIAGQKKANIKQLKKELYIKQISFKKNNHDIIEIYENNNKLCSFHKSEIFQNYLNMQ